MDKFIFIVVFIFLLEDEQQKDLNILLYCKKTVWKDSSDMNFTIKLVNVSSEPKFILDQVFDDVYNYYPGNLDNLSFITQKLEKGKYEGYRDAPLTHYTWVDFRLPNEMLDSIEKVRNPYIKLSSNDTLWLDYSFMIGRNYSRGKYRTRAKFKYDFTGKGKYVESQWVYFEVVDDYLIRPIPQMALESEKLLFWQMK